MSFVYIPAQRAEDWAQLLADPVKHWRTGYSARTLAYSWQSADGFPDEIKAAFSNNEFLSDIQLLIPTTQVVDRGLVIPLSCGDARGKPYNFSPEST